MSPYRYILAEDYFIAYARGDGYRYAEACASHLSKAGFAPAFDQWISRTGYLPPEELTRALRRSCVLVVVGSPDAVWSEHVKDEVTAFSELNRPIVPISVEGSLERARWFDLLRGAPIESETLDALETGQPSDTVHRRIEQAATHRTRSQRQRLASVATIVLIGILAAAGLFVVRSEAKLARDAQAKAAESQKLATVARTAADAAEQRRDQADRETRSTLVALTALQPLTVEDGLADSLRALVIEPTLAAKRSLLQNLSSVSHLRRRVLCPPGESPESEYFSHDQNLLLLLCTGTLSVLSLPDFRALGRETVAERNAPFSTATSQFREGAGGIFVTQEFISPKVETQYLAWPPGRRLPAEPAAPRFAGAESIQTWRRYESDLRKTIEADNCGNPLGAFATVSEHESWGACTTADHLVEIFKLDRAFEKEELRGHTDGPLGRLASSVALMAFDRNEDVRFMATGGQLANGASGFLLWDIRQHHPLSEVLRRLDKNTTIQLELAQSNRVVLCSGCGKTVQILDLQGGPPTSVRELPWFSQAISAPSGRVVFLSGPEGLWRLSLSSPYRLQRVVKTTRVLREVSVQNDDHVLAIEDWATLLSWSPAGVVRVSVPRLLPVDRTPMPMMLSMPYFCATTGGGNTLFAQISYGTSNSLFIAELAPDLSVRRSRVITVPEEAASCTGLSVASAASVLVKGGSVAASVPGAEGATAILRNYWNADARFELVAKADDFGAGPLTADGKTMLVSLNGGFAMLDLTQNRALTLWRAPQFAAPGGGGVTVATDGSFFVGVSANAFERALSKWPLDYRIWQQRTESILR